MATRGGALGLNGSGLDGGGLDGNGLDGPVAVASGSTGLNLFAWFTVAATLFLIFAGGLVTSTGSGLAVPDWPLSFGQVMPEMTGGVFYEHGHRLVASGVGLLTIVLAVWTRRSRSAAVRRLGGLALIAVCVQGGLGGLTVLLRLPPQVSVLHACLAQGFLCLVTAIAVLTGPSFGARSACPSTVHRLGVAATSLIYAQLVVGAIMRHTGAGLAIRDFPTALGGWIPPLTDPAVRIHFLHRVVAVAVVVLVAATVSRVRSAPAEGWVRRVALALGTIVVVQVSLGALTVLSGKQAYITSLHVVGGASLLATSLALTLRTSRRAD